ncbi:MAG: hypothetical protein GKR94_18975 [Gammaproteobacteria bacterium]|nr:hypothetical protein [Gammaproteobacteria bacterium]
MTASKPLAEIKNIGYSIAIKLRELRITSAAESGRICHEHTSLPVDCGA